MRAKIIRFEGTYAICTKEDKGIVNIKRFDIPIQAEEGDVLNITDSSITIENKMARERHTHADDIIINGIW